MAIIPEVKKQNPLIPPILPPNPLMPPPMEIGPSPSMGFQTWASSPVNAFKVQPAMTSPSAPLQPNKNAMASAIPPAIPQRSNPLVPPGMSIPNVSSSSSLNLAPVTPPPSASSPNPLRPPNMPTMEEDQKANPGAYSKKIAHGKVGNILNLIAAGSLGAAGGMNGDPGAGARYAMNVLQHDEGVQSANQDIYNRRIVQPQMNSLKTQQLQGDIAHTAAETKAIPITTALKQQNSQAALAQHGLTLTYNDNGEVTGVAEDPNSSIIQQRNSKDELTQAQIEAAKAGVELKNAQAAFAKAKMDPNSPLFKQTQDRLRIAQSNAAAATQRAQAYMGNYLQGAYGVGLNGEVLPGSAEISDESGNQTVVGTKSAAQAAKSQSNAAQFNDVKGATDNIEKVAETLVKKGGKLNSPSVAAAIADPKTTSAQWAQGQFVNSGLTPEERDYVTTVKAYKENLQALRKSAGGSVSDSQVDRLMEMAPGASTPDLDYLKRQTGQIRQMWGRLAPGATTAKGGLQISGRGNPLKPPARTGTQTFTDGGFTYHIPASQVDAFKKDHPNAR